MFFDTCVRRRYEYKQAVLSMSRLLQGLSISLSLSLSLSLSQGLSRLLQGLPARREARQRTHRLSKADASTLDELEARVRALTGCASTSDGGTQRDRERAARTEAPVLARVAAAVSAQLQDTQVWHASFLRSSARARARTHSLGQYIFDWRTFVAPWQSLRDPDAPCCRGPGSRADYLHGASLCLLSLSVYLVRVAACMCVCVSMSCLCARVCPVQSVYKLVCNVCM